ncbi:MAG TPA: DNA gyrase subunit A [Candidatus Binatia bacterium]|nr:DNA gyrase subunit A [Candidatus Binatia bacterium]
MEKDTSIHPIPINIEQEMRQSYMDYAMSVIIGRALPDVRDGLKPVHRRALYAMSELGNDWNRPYKKSARIVGDVIGKYHPHGDMAVYDTIVRMAQEFSLRYPLIDGQGNFGSVDGDPPAAMRYTEIRMTRIAGELLADIDKETVDFIPNYDDTSREPVVLPAKLPNLLINGSSGIAVGMSTNIPPHNLGEVVDALLALLDAPHLNSLDLMQYIPGPDFPTGAFIYGTAGVREAYETGKGIVQMRARTSVETDKRSGRNSIIAHESPFQVNKARLIERIAELVNEKRIEGIADLRDESDRDGMRIVIELKREAIPTVVLNQLYKLTPLQESFGVILLAIVDGRPRLLTLKDTLILFLSYRREVVRRRTLFDLGRAQDRLHILEGLKIALDNLDAILQLIRSGQNPASVRQGLMSRFSLSENQAQAILDMRLQRLTQLEQGKVLAEHGETVALIARLQAVLVSSQEIDAIIREELSDLRKRFADERRTQIISETADLSVEDLIAEEDMVVTISHEGYIKRNPASLYRSQRRGGKGVVGAATKEEDFAEHLFVSSTHSFLLFFTTIGRVYWMKVHEIPQSGRTTKGKAIVNLLPLREREKISAYLPVREFQDGYFIVFATRKGLVKKTELMAYANPRRDGIIALAIEEDDEVIGVRLTDGKQEILLSTKKGQAIRFSEEEVRPTGRGTYGVKGITLEEGDGVVSLEILSKGATLLTVSSGGYGKRSEVDEYRLQSRGGKGIITMRANDKTGDVVGVRQVTDEDHLMLVTDSGRIIRLRMAELRVIGRNTQGVRLLNVGPDERVVSLALLAEKEDDVEAEESVVVVEETATIAGDTDHIAKEEDL